MEAHLGEILVNPIVFTNKKEWRNDRKELHREDGPAQEFITGTKMWYQNGKLHREDGPAVEYINGDKVWRQNGKLHRENGPAIDFVGGYKEYWIEGNYLSEKEFNNRSKCVVLTDGTKTWKNAKGEFHRLDGPAIEFPDGTKHWYQNGQLHRLDGPAVEYPSGNKRWYRNNKWHREDGPAIEDIDGRKVFYLEDLHYTEKEYYAKIKKCLLCENEE